MIPPIDDDDLPGGDFFSKRVKFAVNHQQDDVNRWLKVPVTQEQLLTHHNPQFDDTDSEVEEENSTSRPHRPPNPLRNQEGIEKTSMLAPENHYQGGLSASASPTVARRLNLAVPPFMDDESGRASPNPDNGDDPMENGLRRFNHSLRSTTSVYSNAEITTWAESEEAKSSLISVLSALYAMVLVILSLAFEVSIAVVDTINSDKYDIFYIYLYSVSLLFFAYCEFFLLRSIGVFSFRSFFNSCRQCCVRVSRDSPKVSLADSEKELGLNEAFLRKRRISMSMKRRASHSASSAGSLYLRMGCVVFGVVGLIMKGLQLFAAFDRRMSSDCFSGTWLAETILTAVFLFVQMFFIFQNSKLIIHRFKTVGRFGAMHLVATNLCTWIRSLVEEQMTIMHEINAGVYHQTSDKKNGRHGHDHPFPTNNRTNSDHVSDVCVSAGVRYGMNSLIADVEPFMTTCIIEYSLICAAVMYILWRNIGHMPRLRVRQRKQRFHVDCTASTQGLFLGILFMVYVIVSMVIFFTKVRSGATEDALIVFYTSYIVLFVGSIAALAIGMYRMRNLFYVHGQKKNIILLDDILLIVGLIGQLMFCVFSVVPLTDVGFTATLIVVSSLLRMVQVLWQTVFIFFAQRLATLTPEMQEKNPGREMVTFLLMTNLALFLINTFETHKAGAIPNLFGFYGEAVWMVIAHSTIPLCIFYRFHSTVCLAEVWKHVYRVKAMDSSVVYHQTSDKKNGRHGHDHPFPTNNRTNSDHVSDVCVSAGVRYGMNSLIADVEPFMTTCIIEYSLICAAVMYILWRNIGHMPRLRVRQRKQRFHVDCTASTQGLFLGILFMVYVIVSMVIFFTKVRSGATEDALIVFYTSYIVLFVGSIAALAIGMYRMRNLFYVHGQKKNIILLDDILLIVGLIGQLMFCVFSVVPLTDVGFTATLIVVSSLLRMVQVLWQTVFIFFAQRLATLTPEMQEKNPGREMVTFLLMTNLALFLINTFETHKAGAIPNLFGFYGEAVWMVIAHSTIPLCIFYRFHSTVCLAEVWKHVYRVKAMDSSV